MGKRQEPYKKKSKIPIILAILLVLIILLGIGILIAPKFTSGNTVKKNTVKVEEDSNQGKTILEDKEKEPEEPELEYKLSELTPINTNDRYKKAENYEDTLGNTYAVGNVMELETYGESIWGEHGYSEGRNAFAEYKLVY